MKDLESRYYFLFREDFSSKVALILLGWEGLGCGLSIGHQNRPLYVLVLGWETKQWYAGVPTLAPVSCTPLPWKRLYLEVWVHYFHKSHVLNELQLIQNMMLVNSKLPKTFEIFTQMSDSVFFPMVPPLHIAWNTDGRLIESGVLFYTILLYFTMWNPTFV